MDIIHRDIKPENILILNAPHPVTGLPVAKLLDFGLSKHAGLGSAAKTFVGNSSFPLQSSHFFHSHHKALIIFAPLPLLSLLSILGTPCYLAPEVEFTAKQLGGTYGPPADCWSLGAVLYVMLVARFPEFDHNVGHTGRLVLRLPPALWSDKSSEAKLLIQGLMCYETDVRLTAMDAMKHPWLREYRIGDIELGLDPSSSGISPDSRPPLDGHIGYRGTHGNDALDMVLCDRYTQDVRKSLAPQEGVMSSAFESSAPSGRYDVGSHFSSRVTPQSDSAYLYSGHNDMKVTLGGGGGGAGGMQELPLTPLLHLQM
jgi:serine/threonine protein kinase